mmetsp:Transcript_119669/g.343766  ORF Transcript_119669/g.343766 Transcript_119669/m.343766 type:complete len:269 (+) Transcript_119669:395-1201(+)
MHRRAHPRRPLVAGHRARPHDTGRGSDEGHALAHRLSARRSQHAVALAADQQHQLLQLPATCYSGASPRPVCGHLLPVCPHPRHGRGLGFLGFPVLLGHDPRGLVRRGPCHGLVGELAVQLGDSGHTPQANLRLLAPWSSSIRGPLRLARRGRGGSRGLCELATRTCVDRRLVRHPRGAPASGAGGLGLDVRVVHVVRRRDPRLGPRRVQRRAPHDNRDGEGTRKDTEVEEVVCQLSAVGLLFDCCASGVEIHVWIQLGSSRFALPFA